MRALLLLICFLAMATSSSGCVGGTRETLTKRTPTEQLLVTTAAERAIGRLDDDFLAKTIAGKRIAIDDSQFVSVDKPYVISALRHRLIERGALLVGDPELIIEIRNGSLGSNEHDFSIGLPALPFPVPGTMIGFVVSLGTPFRRARQEGWAKFQLWLRDPVTHEHLVAAKDLWGSSYYSKWWFFFIGPFDHSHDIYPDKDTLPPKNARELFVKKKKKSKKSAEESK